MKGIKMTDEQMKQIQLALYNLKITLIANKVSIGLTSSNELMFFDTDAYKKENVYEGFSIKIEDLVD